MLKKIMRIAIVSMLLLVSMPYELVKADERNTISNEQVTTLQFDPNTTIPQIQNMSAVVAAVPLHAAMTAAGVASAPYILLGLAALGGGIVIYNNWDDIKTLGKKVANVAYNSFSESIYKLVDVDKKQVNITSNLKKVIAYISANGIDALDNIADVTKTLQTADEQAALKAKYPDYHYQLQNKILSGDNSFNVLLNTYDASGNFVAHLLGDVVKFYDNKASSIDPPVQIVTQVVLTIKSKYNISDTMIDNLSVIFGLANPNSKADSFRNMYDVDDGLLYTKTRIDSKTINIDMSLKTDAKLINARVGTEYDSNGKKVEYRENVISDWSTKHQALRVKGVRTMQNIDVTLSYPQTGETKKLVGNYPENKIVIDAKSIDVIDALLPASLNFNSDAILPATEKIGAVTLPDLSDLTYNTNQKKQAIVASPGVVVLDNEIPGGSNDDDSDEDTSNWDILGFLRKIWAFIKTMLNPVKDTLATMQQQLSDVKDYLASKYDAGTTAISNALSSSYNAITDKISDLSDSTASAFSALGAKIAAFNDAVVDTTGSILDGIGERVKDVIDSIVKVGQDVVSGVGERIDGAKKAISDSVANVVDKIIDTTSAITNSITDSIATALQAVKDFFVPDFAKIKNTWSRFLTTLDSRFGFIKDLQPAFKSAFAQKNSLYDLSITYNDVTFAPFPRTFKPQIDIFRLFLNGVCIMFTMIAVYKRFVGDGDAIAT